MFENWTKEGQLPESPKMEDRSFSMEFLTGYMRKKYLVETVQLGGQKMADTLPFSEQMSLKYRPFPFSIICLGQAVNALGQVKNSTLKFEISNIQRQDHPIQLSTFNFTMLAKTRSFQLTLMETSQILID